MKDRDLDLYLRQAARTTERRPAGPCPGVDTLCAYVEGVLNAEAIRSLEAHAADCDPCRELLALQAVVWRNVTQSPLRMPENVRRRLHPVDDLHADGNVLQLVYDAARKTLEQLMTTGGLGVLHAEGVRATTAARTYRVHIGPVGVQVSTDQRKDGLYEIWLRAEEDDPRGGRMTWQIWSGERLIEQSPAENGEVLFADLNEGQYRCVLLTEGETVGAIDLRLKP